jgi:hypothetical protein
LKANDNNKILVKTGKDMEAENQKLKTEASKHEEKIK